MERMVADIDSVPALFEENVEENNTSVSDPDIEKAHEQAERLKEEAEQETRATDAYTFHWYNGGMSTFLRIFITVYPFALCVNG